MTYYGKIEKEAKPLVLESATSWSKISLRNHYSGAPPNLYTWLIAMNETKSVILVRLCCDLADVTIQYFWSFYLD